MQQQSLSNHDYLQKLLSHLRDLPRRGTNKQISLQQREQIIALASQKPSDHGVEINNWTHQMLAKVAIGEAIVSTISPRHVGNILKKVN